MDTDREEALRKYAKVWSDRSYEENSFRYRGQAVNVISQLNMEEKDHISDWGCGSGLTAK